MEQGLQVAHAGADDSDVSRVISKGITDRVLLELDYYKENEDEYSSRRVEPYALINGREGWYVGAFDPEKDDVRHFRLDRIAARRADTASASSRAPTSTPRPTSTAGRAPGEVSASTDRARLDLARARALGARAAQGRRRVGRRRGSPSS